MQQMLRYGLTGIFLLICTWQDIRTGKIGIAPVFLFGISGVIVDLAFRCPWQLCIAGVLPGAGILLFGRLTKEAIGYGDGLALTVTGLFLTGTENLSLFLTGLFLCAVFTVLLFFIGKLKRKMRLPFLPFLAAGFGIYVLLAVT